MARQKIRVWMDPVVLAAAYINARRHEDYHTANGINYKKYIGDLVEEALGIKNMGHDQKEALILKAQKLQGRDSEYYPMQPDVIDFEEYLAILKVDKIKAAKRKKARRSLFD